MWALDYRGTYLKIINSHCWSTLSEMALDQLEFIEAVVSFVTRLILSQMSVCLSGALARTPGLWWESSLP